MAIRENKMTQENTEEKTCEICGVYKYTTEQQIQGHTYHCLKKHNQTEEKPKEEKPDIRKERVPFGVPTKRFNCPENDGFHYRVFNDQWKKEPGRIQRAKMAGYEMVDNPVSGITVSTNEDGSEVKGVLMRIPKELYDKDQAVKARKLDEIDKQIHRGKFDKNLTNTYGDVKVETKLTG